MLLSEMEGRLGDLLQLGLVTVSNYESVLQHWNLQQVVRVVTDSCSNMVKAFNLPGFDESLTDEEHEEEVLEEECTEQGPPFQTAFAQLMNDMSATYFTKSNLRKRCPIHLLQLAIKDAINSHADVDKIITRTAKLVKRKSTLNTEKADKLCVRPTPACHQVEQSAAHDRISTQNV